MRRSPYWLRHQQHQHHYDSFWAPTGSGYMQLAQCPPWQQRPSQRRGTESQTKQWGIFGQVNLSTTFAGIRDGMSVTIATGEVQRINNVNPGTWSVR